MKLEYGDIEPGIRIGEFKIGLSKKEVLSLVTKDFPLWKEEQDSCIYSFENFKLFFDIDEILIKISVTKGFKDNYKSICIGSSLNDVKKVFGDFEEKYDTYLIKGIKGMCFELEDVEDYDDEWDEMTAPIEWINVYKSSLDDNRVDYIIVARKQ